MLLRAVARGALVVLAALGACALRHGARLRYRQHPHPVRRQFAHLQQRSAIDAAPAGASGRRHHVAVASIAEPDYSLEEHWNGGQVARWLRERQWEYVVLQQGSSALPASQDHLRTWTNRFAPLIRAAGAEPVLLMVWPFETRLFDFPNVLTSYRNAAASVDGMFVPAGDAWTAYGSYEPLYNDGLHPTASGTYLAALTLLGRLRGIRPDRLPPNIPGSAVDSATVRALQRAATTALDRNVAYPPRSGSTLR